MYFFVKNLEESRVSGEEAQVMFSHRLVAGEKITITNLQGSRATAIVEKYDKNTREYYLRTGIIERLEVPTSRTLLQAIIDKQYLDKLAEVAGYSDYTEVVLVATEYSQPTTIDTERLNKIIRKSALLSERSWSPTVRIAEENIPALLEKYNPVVLDLGGEGEKSRFQSIFVGPEGGFSNGEKDLFVNHQLSIVSLGSHVYPGWLAGFVASL